MKIRLLRKGEAREAAAIVGKNYSRKFESLAREEMEDMFNKGGGPRPIYFIAEEHGKIIGVAGYIQSWMDYNVYQIFWVNVAPGHQRKGIGKMLMERLIKEIRRRKNAHLILLTADAKKNLPGYYVHHLGFKTLQVFGSNYHLMSLPVGR